MTRKAEGIIFGNNKKECLAEVLKQLMQYTDCVKVNKFRKVRNRDMYQYKCTITI